MKDKRLNSILKLSVTNRFQLLEFSASSRQPSPRDLDMNTKLSKPADKDRNYIKNVSASPPIFVQGVKDYKGVVTKITYTSRVTSL